MAKERIHWIDIARGITILLVFTGHTISTPGVLGEFIYFFHMPAFFFLSGFCFSDRRKFPDFVANRLKTVILPVFTLGFTGSVFVALLMYITGKGAPDVSVLLLSPVIQTGEKSLLWFLPASFVSTTVFYGLVKLSRSRISVTLFLSALLAAGGYLFIRFVGVRVPWSVDTALVALPFVAGGYFLKNKGFAGKLKKIYILVPSFLLCICTGVVNKDLFSGVEMHTNLYGNVFLFYLSAFFGIIFLVSMSMFIEKNKALEYFGRNSLVFYALEPIQYFANFTLKALSFGTGNKDFNLKNMIVTVVAVSAITVASCAATAVINRYFPVLIGKKKEAQA